VAQTQAPVEAGAPSRAGAQPPGPRGRPGSTTTTGMIVKIALLGLVLAIAIFGAFPLIEQQQWLALALLVLVTAVIFWVYLSPRRIPAKYLIPGTLFLLAFQVFPVLYTMSTAFTNFGDAHRGSKEDAIQAIEGASIQKVEGSTDYRLTVATKGDPITILPLITPILAVTGLLGFIAYVNEFLIANVFLTDPESKTLAVGLFGLVAGERNNNFGMFAAGAVLAAIPTVLLFQILQRFIVGGLTTGAVKG
jgi:hypothetical protein